MATDATGTPTSLGIPTYNVDNDAPSGLGFNATMAVIDTLLIARIAKPASIVTGETAVWNGSAFARSTVTKLGTGSLSGYPWVNADIDAAAAIAVSKLAPGSAAQVLTTTGGVAVWATPSTSSIGYATTLPGSPVDGQEAILVDSTTLPTYQWRFRYNAGSSNTDKWECVGGIPAVVVVAAREGSSSTTFAALSTAGPTFTTPRAGVYDVTVMCHSDSNGGNGGGMMGFDVGGTGATDADQAGGTVYQNSDQAHAASISFTSRKTGVAASTALTSKYKVNTGTQFFEDRKIFVMPVRVS